MPTIKVLKLRLGKLIRNNMKGFEQYKGYPHLRKEPTVSYYKASGEIMFSDVACEVLNIPNRCYVSLFYNKKTEQIALRVHNDFRVAGSIRLIAHHKGRGGKMLYGISCKPFIRFYKIKKRYYRTVLSDVTKEDDFIVLDAIG